MSAVPPERKKPLRKYPKMGPVKPWVDAILAADRHSPRKQRHTAHQIYVRLRTEMPLVEVAVSESSVRRYVRKRRLALGLIGREVFVPQSYKIGGEAQVHWYECWVNFEDGRRKVCVFCMRSMTSGAAFHRAYLHATQQSFLEAHEQVFAWLGGVFRTLRYDNLASAMKRILRSHQREEATRSIAFRSHWGFQSRLCTPGEGHEKCGVEGGAGSGGITWCR